MSRRINWKRIITHVLFWAIYVIYKIVDHGWDNRDYIALEYMPQLFTDLPMTIALVYTNLYFLMPRYLYPKQYGRYAVSLFLLMLAGGIYGRFTAYLLWVPWGRIHYPGEYGAEPGNFFIPLRFVRNSVEFYPVVAVTMLIRMRNHAYQQEKRLRELEQEKFKAELNFLKSQLHPHFFFNTLNSLYALTLKKSERSPEVVLRLSGLMHYVLYDSNADFVPLQADIGHLKDYLGIEEMRFADRLELSFQYSGDLDNKIIAPLLLLPFVENAFKHGLRNEMGKAWIIIDIKVSGNKLFFKSENSCPRGSVPLNGKGVGLTNVRRRLELSYPGRYELQMGYGEAGMGEVGMGETGSGGNTGEAVFRVDLKLQLDAKN